MSKELNKKNSKILWAEEQEKKVPWWNLWDRFNWWLWKARHESDE